MRDVRTYMWIAERWLGTRWKEKAIARRIRGRPSPEREERRAYNGSEIWKWF